MADCSMASSRRRMLVNEGLLWGFGLQHSEEATGKRVWSRTNNVHIEVASFCTLFHYRRAQGDSASVRIIQFWM